MSKKEYFEELIDKNCMSPEDWIVYDSKNVLKQIRKDSKDDLESKNARINIIKRIIADYKDGYSTYWGFRYGTSYSYKAVSSNWRWIRPLLEKLGHLEKRESEEELVNIV